MKKFDIIDEIINSNAIHTDDEIKNIHRKIEDVSDKELKKLDERSTKMEESINKINQSLTEKFKKLENDFRFNISNIESKNMEVLNQTNALKDSFERNKKIEEQASSNRRETEPEVIRRVLSPVGSIKNTEPIVVPEEMKAELKNELIDYIDKKFEEITNIQSEKMESLYQDFMVIKRNTVDEVLKNIELKKYPTNSRVEDAIQNIIYDRIQRSLSAPSRIGIKV